MLRSRTLIGAARRIGAACSSPISHHGFGGALATRSLFRRTLIIQTTAPEQVRVERLSDSDSGNPSLFSRPRFSVFARMIVVLQGLLSWSWIDRRLRTRSGRRCWRGCSALSSLLMEIRRQMSLWSPALFLGFSVRAPISRYGRLILFEP